MTKVKRKVLVNFVTFLKAVPKETSQNKYFKNTQLVQEIPVGEFPVKTIEKEFGSDVFL